MTPPPELSAYGRAVVAPQTMSTQSTEPHTAGSSVDFVDALDGWERPMPLGEPEQPPFPVDRLGRLRDIVHATAEAYQVPADLPGLMALTLVSAAIGGRRSVQIRPDWAETASLFAVAALPSGERKSPVMAQLDAPIREAEHSMADDSADDRADHAQRHRLLKSRLEESERDAVKQKDDTKRGEAENNAMHLRRELDELGEPPVPPRLIASDITPEAIARVMSEQDGRLSILATEGGIFDTLAGRYSGTPNFDVLLNAYSGESVTVDRQSKPPLRVPVAHLSMGLCVQPQVLEDIGRKQDAGFRGKGLLGRFLYAVPQSMVGIRAIDPEPIPEDVRSEWGWLLRGLVSRVWNSDPTTLTLDADAAEAMRAYRVAHEPRLGDAGDLADLREWAAKLPGNLARLALVLTLAEDPHATTVTGGRMRDALAMSDYLEAHARHAHDLMSNGRYHRLYPARSVLAWIRRKQVDSFSLRELHRSIEKQAWVTSADDVQAAVDELAEAGWIAAESPEEDTARVGRPRSPRWLVSPYAHREHVDKTDKTNSSERGSVDSVDALDTSEVIAS